MHNHLNLLVQNIYSWHSVVALPWTCLPDWHVGTVTQSRVSPRPLGQWFSNFFGCDPLQITPTEWRLTPQQQRISHDLYKAFHCLRVSTCLSMYYYELSNIRHIDHYWQVLDALGWIVRGRRRRCTVASETYRPGSKAAFLKLFCAVDPFY